MQGCRIATPDTQREYSWILLVLCRRGSVLWANVYIVWLLEIADNEFEMEIIINYG